jgi:predicted nucleic acid-binding Zn ribbon protein
MIPQHGHCQVCGKAVKFGEPFCSEKCEQDYQGYLKKRKMYVYIMYAALAFLMVLVVLQITGQ